MGSTIIRKGVKLDNLIMIAHNVEIGKNTVIAAQTGISGSTKIGKNCLMGGQVGMAGHLSIANEVKIGAQAGIGSSVKKEGSIPIPIKLTFIYSDGTESVLYKDASVWSDGKDEIIITEKTTKMIEKIKLGDAHIPDVNYKRNTYIIEK